MTMTGLRQDPSTSLGCRRDHRWKPLLLSSSVGEFAAKSMLVAKESDFMGFNGVYSGELAFVSHW